ncbi:MAG: metallophosphoesterase family protein, partial [Anaerolineales bacterium]|nr:metallophosphoesterase family protein [Anaerolineales bacterium]
MRIAIISDVHANLPALEAVLAHAQKKGCSEFWNLGDNVGYGPFPEQTVQRLQDLPGESILGNYDRKVLAFPDKKGRWKKSKHSQKYLAFGWAYRKLSKSSRKYLAALASEVEVEIKGQRFLLTHGSPFSDEEPILPSTPPRRLREIGKQSAAPVILCGHTHIPFVFEMEKWSFINPGSVGRP